jgi:hypothetical protein
MTPRADMLAIALIAQQYPVIAIDFTGREKA